MMNMKERALLNIRPQSSPWHMTHPEWIGNVYCKWLNRRVFERLFLKYARRVSRMHPEDVLAWGVIHNAHAGSTRCQQPGQWCLLCQSRNTIGNTLHKHEQTRGKMPDLNYILNGSSNQNTPRIVQARLGGGDGVMGTFGTIRQRGMERVMRGLELAGMDTTSTFVDIGAGLGQ
jgi:hypothetical protein